MSASDGQRKLAIVPCSVQDAKAFVAQHHRTHKAPLSGLFALAVADDAGMVRGVAIVGRPVARMNQDGFTAEVTRVATDGCPNACSALYGACWRVAQDMGYRRLITYVLNSEPGTSLRASGWVEVGKVTGRSWSCPSRPRVDTMPQQGKLRFEVTV